MAERPTLAGPELAPCAFAGRTWRLWADRHPPFPLPGWGVRGSGTERPATASVLGPAARTAADPTAVCASRRAHVRPARHGQDAAGARGGAPHRLHVHPRLRLRARTKVHRRGVAHGA
eukprot:scaffold76239_cov54-Phaeocystis_antarctica.AAC.1